MRVFVSGVGGQLGHDVVNELVSRGYEAVGSDLQPAYSGINDSSAVTVTPYIQLDITDKAAVDKVVGELNPDVIIHCAAWTAVDVAEDPVNVDKVFDINAGGKVCGCQDGLYFYGLCI